MFHTKKDLEEAQEQEWDKTHYVLMMHLIMQNNPQAASRHIRKEMAKKGEGIDEEAERAAFTFSTGDPWFHTVQEQPPDEIMEMMLADQHKFGQGGG